MRLGGTLLRRAGVLAIVVGVAVLVLVCSGVFTVEPRDRLWTAVGLSPGPLGLEFDGPWESPGESPLRGYSYDSTGATLVLLEIEHRSWVRRLLGGGVGPATFEYIATGAEIERGSISWEEFARNR